jgi:kynureninase
LSLRVVRGRRAGRELFAHLGEHGVICDWREPDVIRIAPVPLYNSFEDCVRFVDAVRDWQKA